jgi:cation diffusion facilitator family transporter
MNNGTSVTAADNYKFQKYIVALSGITLLTKFAAWLLTGSVALFTDALETSTNVAAGLIGLYALYLSMKPRDFDHPYGHGRAEFLSATVEGAMIVIAGAIVIIEGVRRILDPVDIPALEIGLILSFVTVILNFSFGTMAARKGKKNRSTALMASGRHLQSDAYSTAGIIIGLLLLYVFRGMGYDVLWLDGAIALLFGAIIIVAGASVLKRSVDGIMDKVDVELMNKMVTALSNNRREAWIDIHNLRMVKYGPTVHMDMHVTVPWDMSVEDAHKEVCLIIELIRKSYGDSAELSVSCDPCKPFSCPGCTRDCKERKAEFVKLVEWNVKNLSEEAQHGEMCKDEDG